MRPQSNKTGKQGGAIMAYFIIMTILSIFIAATGAYVAQTSRMTQRRNNMISALQYAEGAAVIAVKDLSTAVLTNNSSSLFTRITAIPYAPYTLNASLGGGTNKVYIRTIAAGAPFNRQPVNVQIWIPNVSSPPTAKIVSSATVGSVTQMATVNAKISFAYGAAILSVNDGTVGTSATKTLAQAGNVSINGSGAGPLVVWGGTNGLVALANGTVNLSSTNTSVVDIPSGTISQTNYAKGTPIPDYTSQGTSNTLFDINRFIAVANATPTNAGFAPSGNNHFTNLTTFTAAAGIYNPTIHSGGKNAMEGVIVVDVSQSDAKNLSSTDLPYGINVRGSLIFNFTGGGWTPTSKIVIDAPINVNPANLSGLTATNPATYTTGYPPTFTNPTNAPYNINISGAGYQNFTTNDDLPAILYNIGEVDYHGPLDICGAMYSPSYMEIENKHAGQTQYIDGELIMGNGIYLENNSAATTVVAYDKNSVNNLSTAGTAGKMLSVTYWQ